MDFCVLNSFLNGLCLLVYGFCMDVVCFLCMAFALIVGVCCVWLCVWILYGLCMALCIDFVSLAYGFVASNLSALCMVACMVVV